MGSIFSTDSNVIHYIMTFELKYRIFLLKVQLKPTLKDTAEIQEKEEKEEKKESGYTISEYIIPEDSYQL
jgi:hypothetical protein